MTLGIFDPAFLAVAGAVAGGSYDADAQAYITAVEAADGQSLETGVKDAINAFVVGCKADGIWNAIKASCIMAGARTPSGALTPLVGTAPTNFNFVSGDYNRKTGLVGNGSTKYLDSNRNNNADPQNSNHNAVYIAEVNGNNFSIIGAADPFNESGANSIGLNLNTNFFSRNRSSASFAVTGSTAIPGFAGVFRAGASSYTLRALGSNNTVTEASQAPSNRNVIVFGRVASTALAPSRLAFYSIGESLDLALLDARVTTLINAYAAAIP